MKYTSYFQKQRSLMDGPIGSASFWAENRRNSHNLIQSGQNYCHPSNILALLAAGSISPIIPAIMGLPMAPIIGLLIIGLPIIPRPKWYVVSIHLHNILIIWCISIHEEYESARQSGNWGSPCIWQQAVSSHCAVRFILGCALHTSYYSITIWLQGKSSRDAYHLWTQNPYTFHTWRVAHLTQNGAGSLLRGGRAWTFRSSGALVSWRDCRIDIWYTAILLRSFSCTKGPPLMKGQPFSLINWTSRDVRQVIIDMIIALRQWCRSWPETLPSKGGLKTSQDIPILIRIFLQSSNLQYNIV